MQFTTKKLSELEFGANTDRYVSMFIAMFANKKNVDKFYCNSRKSTQAVNEKLIINELGPHI